MTDPRKLFHDQRLLSGCIYCGAPAGTRDHVPSKVLLDEPLPPDLPVVGCCQACNNGFSLDEEYLACFLDCTINGCTSPTVTFREKVARILKSKPQLAKEIANTCQSEGELQIWYPDLDRVKNVLLKLARGHAAYECAEVFRHGPDLLSVKPLAIMSTDERKEFELDSPFAIWPEIGSRAFLRASGMIKGELSEHGWQIVQRERYRYRVDYSESPFTVKLVLSEYLSCQIGWY